MRWRALLSIIVFVAAAATRNADAQTRRPEGVTPEIEGMIEAGSRFLVRTQNPDGSWNNNGGWGSYPVAMTALAGTALLMTGSTPNRGPYARAISKATDFLLKSTREDGLVASPSDSHSMHGHGFALLFLGQVYGMTQDEDLQNRLANALRRGCRLTERSQSRAGGWLYTPDSDGDEGSVTVTQIQGLRSARNAGIQVNANTIRRAIRYIERSQNPDGGIRYTMGSGGPSRPPISAAAIATLYNAGVYDSPMVEKCTTFCQRAITVHGAGSDGHYFYTHLYYGQAKYQRGGREWSSYYRDIANQLRASRNASDGSWNGDGVGTTYGTAIALIILQLPYAYVPIFQR
jgi:hypothetical protein